MFNVRVFKVFMFSEGSMGPSSYNGFIAIYADGLMIVN